MSAALPFFVYGTLRRGERNHDAHLAGRTRREEPATLTGALLYEGPGFPYLVETGDGGLVHGELITPLPALWEAVSRDLDHLEGYTPGALDGHYDRVSREVRRADGSPVRAWVYVASERVAAPLRAHGRVVEGGDWCRRRGLAGGPSAC